MLFSRLLHWYRAGAGSLLDAYPFAMPRLLCFRTRFGLCRSRPWGYFPSDEGDVRRRIVLLVCSSQSRLFCLKAHGYLDSGELLLVLWIIITSIFTLVYYDL